MADRGVETLRGVVAAAVVGVVALWEADIFSLLLSSLTSGMDILCRGMTGFNVKS